VNRIAVIVTAVGAGVILCLVGGLAITGGVVTGAACMPPAATLATAASPPSTGQRTGQWDREQLDHATTVVAVGLQRQVPPRGWVIALATAMQESSLRNLEHLGEDNDHDSLGLFQQRPSQGWGTPEQILNPEHAAGEFYGRLVTIDGWEQMPVAEAARAVQRSTHPMAYAKWEPDAVALAAAVTGTTTELLTLCGAGGWVLPVDGPMVSGFRTAQRPDHDGIDIAAPKGTPIRAAASGTVTTSTCNAYTADGSPYPCDIDGSPSVRGCGWYVNLQHPDNTLTRYCHMVSRPMVGKGETVNAGQVIGHVGSSGSSSGPHLHLETHIGHPATSGSAVEPTGFLAARGVAVG
jgi:murein DD-endopeptidase MepM/ murein hydrolase activator NlpD